MCAALITALSVAASAQFYAQNRSDAIDVLRDGVLTLQGAFIMLPPQAILKDVDDFEWSPSGNHILAFSHTRDKEVREALSDLTRVVPPSQERFVAIVDPDKGSFKWVAGMDGPLQFPSVMWPPSGNFCLLAGTVPAPAEDAGRIDVAYLIDLTTGRARKLTSGRMGADMRPFRDETTLMFIYGNNYTTVESVALLDASGRELPLPAGFQKAMAAGWEFGWYSPRLGAVMSRGRPPEYAVLLPGGTLQNLSKEDAVSDFRVLGQENPPPPVLNLSLKKAIQGFEATLLAGTDIGHQNSAVVCGMVEGASLHPDDKCVVYTSQRMLYVRRLKKIDGDVAAVVVQLAIRRERMSMAKQIGTAVNIYAADNEERFPKGDIVNELMPYCKNSSLFKDFVFTLPNVNTVLDVESVSTAEIGHFKLPGGRVVVYVDSSVKWVPEP